jgi:hypothetical protein
MSHGGFSGHASGGSFSGHSFSGRSGGRSFSGARSRSGFVGRASSRGSSRGSLLSSRGFHSSRGFNRRFDRDDRFRNFRFRNNCFGFVCRGFNGYPYWYDPYWSDYDSSYDQDQQDEIGLANQMNQQSLEEQQMRQQQDQQDFYANVGPAAPPRPRPQQTSEAVPATVLVFNDQHKQEVQNYAIVGQTLFNFAPQHTEKIPLSNLDIPATTKANDERGVDFHVPVAHEGQ